MTLNSRFKVIFFYLIWRIQPLHENKSVIHNSDTKFAIQELERLSEVVKYAE